MSFPEPQENPPSFSPQLAQRKSLRQKLGEIFTFEPWQKYLLFPTVQEMVVIEGLILGLAGFAAGPTVLPVLATAFSLLFGVTLGPIAPLVILATGGLLLGLCFSSLRNFTQLFEQTHFAVLITPRVQSMARAQRSFSRLAMTLSLVLGIAIGMLALAPTMPWFFGGLIGLGFGLAAIGLFVGISALMGGHSRGLKFFRQFFMDLLPLSLVSKQEAAVMPGHTLASVMSRSSAEADSFREVHSEGYSRKPSPGSDVHASQESSHTHQR